MPRWMPSPVEALYAADTQRRLLQLLEELVLGAEAAGGDHHRGRVDLDVATLAVDGHPQHPALVVLADLGDRRVGPERQVVRGLGLLQFGAEHLQDRHSLVAAVVGAGRAVRLVAVDNAGRFGREGEAAFVEPVDGLRGVVRQGLDEVLAGGALADAPDVVQVCLGRVLDAPFGLAAGAGGGEVATGDVQGAADQAVLLHQQHPRAALGGADRAGDPRRARADDDHVVGAVCRTVHKLSPLLSLGRPAACGRGPQTPRPTPAGVGREALVQVTYRRRPSGRGSGCAPAGRR